MLLTAVALAGCASKPKPPAPPAESPAAQPPAAAAPPADDGARSLAMAPTQNYATIKVYYGTDRAVSGWATGPSNRYGASAGPLSYGTAEVSIPRSHKMGALEERSVWRLEFRDDPGKHVLLLSADGLAKGEFFDALGSAAAGSKPVLVFVHGYAVSFEDAARRTAQMKYDIGFEGPAVFFSWPSAASVASYESDAAAMKKSKADITAFLKDVAEKTGGSDIYVIAHSMGNEGLTSALKDLSGFQKGKLLPRFKEVVLAAPDIDRDVFVNDILPRVRGKAGRITLYTSASDTALAISEVMNKTPRLGNARAGIVIAQGLDTIDATGVDTGLIGHTYYADNRSIISDMFYLLGEHLPPNERFGLEPVSGGQGTYWRFKG